MSAPLKTYTVELVVDDVVHDVVTVNAHSKFEAKKRAKAGTSPHLNITAHITEVKDVAKD